MTIVLRESDPPRGASRPMGASRIECWPFWELSCLRSLAAPGSILDRSASHPGKCPSSRASLPGKFLGSKRRAPQEKCHLDRAPAVLGSVLARSPDRPRKRPGSSAGRPAANRSQESAGLHSGQFCQFFSLRQLRCTIEAVATKKQTVTCKPGLANPDSRPQSSPGDLPESLGSLGVRGSPTQPRRPRTGAPRPPPSPSAPTTILRPRAKGRTAHRWPRFTAGTRRAPSAGQLCARMGSFTELARPAPEAGVRFCGGRPASKRWVVQAGGGTLERQPSRRGSP